MNHGFGAQRREYCRGRAFSTCGQRFHGQPQTDSALFGVVELIEIEQIRAGDLIKDIGIGRTELALQLELLPGLIRLAFP